MVRFWRIGVCLLLCLWLGANGRFALAQTDNNAGTSRATYAYGQSVQFELAGIDPDTIEQARLIIQTAPSPNPLSVDVTTYGVKSEAFSGFRFTQAFHAAFHISPFATVLFWWELVDQNGRVINVPSQSFFYEDTQYVWSRTQDDGVIVHWTGQSEKIGDTGLVIALESRERMSQLLPAGDRNEPISLYIYPSSADLRSSLRLNGMDWDLISTMDVGLVTAVNPRTAAADLQQSIPHEIARLWMNRLAAPNQVMLPAWLQEGVAAHMEKVPNPLYDTVLETAVRTGTTFPLTDLCDALPEPVNDRILAEAQSSAVVHFIQQEYGNQAIRDLVKAAGEGLPCNQAVDSVLNISVKTLNKDWLDSYQLYSPLLQFWIDNGVWFLLMVGSLAFMGLLIWKM